MYFLIFQWQIYINKLKHARKIRKNFIQLKHYSSTNYYIVSLTTTTYCKIHNNGLLLL